MVLSQKQIRLASIGDFCVDYYVDSNKFYLGGTAYNVAVQAETAGAKSSVISAVGADEPGHRFRSILHSLHINTERLRVLEGETSKVLVRLNESMSPDFFAWNLGVLNRFSLVKEDENFLRTQHAVRNILLSGLVTQFEQFCSFNLPETLKVADFAGGSQYSVETDEITQYASRLNIILRSIQIPSDLEFLERISKDYHIITIGTMGKAGSIAFDNGKKYEQPALETDVVDTTGAGDAYIANFIVTYVKTRNVHVSMQKATEAARHIVAVKGASDQASLE